MNKFEDHPIFTTGKNSKIYISLINFRNIKKLGPEKLLKY